MGMIHQIALWGDSVMKGVLWNRESQKYKLAPVNAVELASAELGVDMRNRSKMGCTAPKGFLMLQKDVASGIRPQAALIEFGGNDCDFDWAAVSEAPEQAHLPHTPLPEFESQLRTMIQYLRAHGIVPILASLVPNHAERYFNFITRTGLSKENILAFLGDVQHIYRWHERYNGKVLQVAREENCPVLDLRGAFLNQWNYADFLCEDGIHPNEKGYSLIADTLFTEGKRLLIA